MCYATSVLMDLPEMAVEINQGPTKALWFFLPQRLFVSPSPQHHPRSGKETLPPLACEKRTRRLSNAA